MTITLLYLLGGLTTLYFGGQWLVDGSSSVARKYRVRPFVIGAVIIGFGTSAPEAFVSVVAQWKGSSGLAFGNIVGSSVANIGLVLGFVALIHPIKVEQSVVKWEYPFLVAATLVLVGFAVVGEFLRWHAFCFFALFGVFLGWSLTRGASVPGYEHPPGKHEHGFWVVAKILIGIVALIGGSELLVRSGAVLARHFGVSELIIGTTVVAVGTSLPELAAAGIAASQRQGQLALGNIIGSNVFNLLFVSGLALLIGPIPMGGESLKILLPGLVVFTFALFPIFKMGRKVGRRDGMVLLLCYAVFIVFLFAFRQAAA